MKNALRYFPTDVQPTLIDEFQYELDTYGHIYMYRFQPDVEMRAYPIDEYPCRCKAAAGIMLMIMNNLDRRVAQFPDELVTYGGNGQVFSNWAQVKAFDRYEHGRDRSTFVLVPHRHALFEYDDGRTSAGDVLRTSHGTLSREKRLLTSCRHYQWSGTAH